MLCQSSNAIEVYRPINWNHAWFESIIQMQFCITREPSNTLSEIAKTYCVNSKMKFADISSERLYSFKHRRYVNVNVKSTIRSILSICLSSENYYIWTLIVIFLFLPIWKSQTFVNGEPKLIYLNKRPTFEYARLYEYVYC